MFHRMTKERREQCPHIPGRLSPRQREEAGLLNGAPKHTLRIHRPKLQRGSFQWKVSLVKGHLSGGEGQLSGEKGRACALGLLG